MQNSTPDTREEIRAAGLREGFDIVRFTRAQRSAEDVRNLRMFLEDGRHGTMDWLARDADRRADPTMLWARAKSIIVLGMNYGQNGDWRARLARRECGTISCYAQGNDYHELIKSRLKRIAGQIAREYGAKVKVFVDTAPVMEKPLAKSAGVGWQGKHTNLVSRQYGSWLFLGSVFTTMEIAADEPEMDHCGRCTRCMDICPTQAFTGPFQMDARRCISYLTIEHKGHIPRELRPALGNRIYGCDDCLAVCPWNKFASVSKEAKLHARAELQQPRLDELVELDDSRFRVLFRRSPVKRIGRDRFVRNVLIAIGNSGQRSLAVAAERRVTDASPLVRAMAVWAISRLDWARALELSHECLAKETDADVRAEWAFIVSPAATLRLDALAQ